MHLQRWWKYYLTKFLLNVGVDINVIHTVRHFPPAGGATVASRKQWDRRAERAPLLVSVSNYTGAKVRTTRRDCEVKSLFRLIWNVTNTKKKGYGFRDWKFNCADIKCIFLYFKYFPHQVLFSLFFSLETEGEAQVNVTFHGFATNQKRQLGFIPLLY